VKLNGADPPPYLRQDMTVSVDTEVARANNVLVAPIGAVRDALAPQPWVMVVRDGHAVHQPVKLGLRCQRIGFTFARPEIADNARMEAGGLKIEVVEPFKRLRVIYWGKILLLANPCEMAEPKTAWRNNPSVPCIVEIDWDENGYQRALVAVVGTESGKTYRVAGKVLSLIPLRNRRTKPDSTELQTRITEGMTEYRCDGRVGYGMSEYLDQIIDGQPSGRTAGY
jgi:hypothetical protein